MRGNERNEKNEKNERDEKVREYIGEGRGSTS
jgi:hypothetical protein